MIGGVLGCAGCAAVVTARDLEVQETEVSPTSAIAMPGEPPLPHAPTNEPAVPRVDGEELLEGCVENLLYDALARVVQNVSLGRGYLAVRMLPDIDGDGREEWLVTVEYECGVTGNCPVLLYRSGHGCTTYTDAFWSAYESESVLPHVRNGLHDLEVWLKGGCAGFEVTIEHMGWTGTRYETYTRIECDCDETDPARDPACPGPS
jgi:hypothetical protein